MSHALIETDAETIDRGVAEGLLVLDGDAYALTEKGEAWFRYWLAQAEAELGA